MQNSGIVYGIIYSYNIEFVWRQLESCVFRCGNSGCRIFYFFSTEQKQKTEEKKQ